MATVLHFVMFVESQEKVCVCIGKIVWCVWKVEVSSADVGSFDSLAVVCAAGILFKACILFLLVAKATAG